MSYRRKDQPPKVVSCIADISVRSGCDILFFASSCFDPLGVKYDHTNTDFLMAPQNHDNLLLQKMACASFQAFLYNIKTQVSL